MSNLVAVKEVEECKALATRQEKYYQEIKVRTELDAISSTTPTVASLRKVIGEVKARAILVLLINDLVEFFSIGKSMNDMQCAQTVDLIIKKFYYLNIADIKLCFDRIKDGTYGKLYDRMDGQIILMAMQEYADGRLNVAEYASDKRHDLAKDDSDEDLYVVKVDGKYLRELDDSYETVEKKDMATPMTIAEAQRIKKALKGGTVTAERKNKSDIGLMQWIKQQRPEIADMMIDKVRRRDDKVREIRTKIAAINVMEISPYEKSCLTRDELGLERETEAEYIEGMKAMIAAKNE